MTKAIMNIDGALELSVCGLDGEIWLFFRWMLRTCTRGFANALNVEYEKREGKGYSEMWAGVPKNGVVIYWEDEDSVKSRFYEINSSFLC